VNVGEDGECSDNPGADEMDVDDDSGSMHSHQISAVPVAVASAGTEPATNASSLPPPNVTLAGQSSNWAQQQQQHATNPTYPSSLASNLPPLLEGDQNLGQASIVSGSFESLPQTSLPAPGATPEPATEGVAQVGPELQQSPAFEMPQATESVASSTSSSENGTDNSNSTNATPVEGTPAAIVPHVAPLPPASVTAIINNNIANPIAIPGANPDLTTFLYGWALSSQEPTLSRRPAARQVPVLSRLEQLVSSKLKGVRYNHLDGNRCDLQGIDWSSLGVTRRAARRRRMGTYKNYTNVANTDTVDDMQLLMSTDSYFRFQKAMIRRDVVLSHFQLRSLLACPTRTQAFYPGAKGVYRLDTAAPLGATSVAIDLSDAPSLHVTTLDANNGILVAGTFNGEYLLRRTDSDSPRYASGVISDAYSQSSITNHLQLYQHRGSGPAVAFSSNDGVFRAMDVTTEQFMFCKPYRAPMNCSAISPDQRLRVMVGDKTDVSIVNAETGEELVSLSGHKDFGFSCDWSQDGWTVATGFQDKTVKIWDARKWCDTWGKSTPVTSIRSEMAGVRALRFSPVGSGARVLVAAEEADFVNIIEARLFLSKQTFDLFGEIGGVSFSNEGNDLSVLLCDRLRGGVVKFEQTGIGFNWHRDDYSMRNAYYNRRPWTPASALSRPLDDTWSNYSAWDEGPAVNLKRRAAVLDNMEPF
jgi:hypothetical protein